MHGSLRENRHRREVVRNDHERGRIRWGRLLHHGWRAALASRARIVLTAIRLLRNRAATWSRTQGHRLVRDLRSRSALWETRGAVLQRESGERNAAARRPIQDRMEIQPHA